MGDGEEAAAHLILEAAERLLEHKVGTARSRHKADRAAEGWRGGGSGSPVWAMLRVGLLVGAAV